MNSYSQSHSEVRVVSEVNASSLLAERIEWNDELGRPFRGTISLLSESGSVDLKAMLMTSMSIGVASSFTDGVTHWISGIVSEFAHLGRVNRLYRYRATIVPAISLMQHSGGCRIFQTMTTVEIVQQLFREHGFEADMKMQLHRPYAKRQYCVQYNESDANFVHRLLEEEGIYYCFEHAEAKHFMVLCDDPTCHSGGGAVRNLPYRDVIQPALGEQLTNLVSTQRFGSGTVSIADYDFIKPKTKLNTKQNSSLYKDRFEDYRYPGRFQDSDMGHQQARLRMEAEEASRAAIQLEGNCRGLLAGTQFQLSQHPQSQWNQAYLVTSSRWLIEATSMQSDKGGALRVENSISCQLPKIPFRPRRSTPRPNVAGPHTATVCGKAGEEIWTDEYGRIKVRFPWDRESKGDEHSSCWIRVSQSWTGKQWGAMALPRIGDEVIVEFIDGDPDRPIVTGRVYNADRMPPESLAAAQSKTIFRTRSTKGGDATAFHELTFEDLHGKESIYFHSERDFHRVVENDDQQQIGFEKKAPGNQTIQIYNDQTLEVGIGSGSGSLTHTIQKDRTTTLQDGNDTTSVQKGDWSISVASGSATITAAKSIVLKCGGSKIEMTPSGIQVTASQISIHANGALSAHGATAELKADGSLDLVGAMGSFKASGVMSVKGALVQIN
jgi:type VI secretion system secreted protein VgrG